MHRVLLPRSWSRWFKSWYCRRVWRAHGDYLSGRPSDFGWGEG